MKINSITGPDFSNSSSALLRTAAGWLVTAVGAFSVVALASASLSSVGDVGVTGRASGASPSQANATAGAKPSTTEGRECLMDIEVVERVSGRCLPLGRSAMGCVAAAHVRPFHPSCV
ncbi:uncharacterized protein LOC126161262 [Schistocerca cancellata]|uniref:uncharacterized protein LOC126161262 n=1 Tax=Schistocerca cancellata TaxID=274614 RepID=UPI0021192179|nr:uncharacterized protein LOC126161262 [Schistocerca cancellata]